MAKIYEIKKKPIEQTIAEMLAAFEKYPELTSRWGHMPSADEVRAFLIQSGSYKVEEASPQPTPNKEEPVGMRLWEVRNIIGISVSELSKRSGISKSYIRRVERGDSIPTLVVITKLAEALGVAPNDLYRYK